MGPCALLNALRVSARPSNLWSALMVSSALPGLTVPRRHASPPLESRTLPAKFAWRGPKSAIPAGAPHSVPVDFLHHQQLGSHGFVRKSVYKRNIELSSNPSETKSSNFTIGQPFHSKETLCE